MANTTVASKPLEAANYPAIVAAVATALGGYKLFEPKLERIRAVRNEVGRLELGFRFLYQWPQCILILMSSAIFVYLVVAFFETLHPGALIGNSRAGLVKAAFAPEATIWLIASIPIVGGVIYWNGLPRLLMTIARVLTFGRMGPNGKSIGWHQTAAVVEGPDKGQPLMIDDQAIERVAWSVLGKLIKDAGAKDYAAEPNLSNEEKANIALFGCIMEAIHYAQRWPLPDWSKFYAALADIQLGANPIFAPAQLMAFTSGQAFLEAFRERLEDALTARNLSIPPDRALAAAADLTRAWERLTKLAQGDVLKLPPWIAGRVGSKASWLDHRLRGFPRLNDDSMRPQLIKLLMRWNVVPVTTDVFIQPFSKDQSWLLLQEGALRALPDQKEVTFHGKGQVGIARIAAFRVVRQVAALIEQEDSKEAAAAAQVIGPSKWGRLETADFAFWSWANSTAKEAAAANWDKAKWRWKLEGGRAYRQS